MKKSRSARWIVLALLMALAGVAFAELTVEKSDPVDGATLSRPPRALRIWFSEEPDVEASELQLEGPEGELELQGLHTMGYEDLMVRVVGRMPDGTYIVHWKTATVGGEERSGKWTFEVKRGS